MESDGFLAAPEDRQTDGIPSNKIDYQEYEIYLQEPGCPKKQIIFERSPSRIKASWRVPLRILRLLVLVALLPTLFIVIPLYLRYFVFSGQIYPVGMSDMRLIDNKVSTTWCQKQLVRSNATNFNAFLLSTQPKLANQLKSVSMTRHLFLDDDMKEYWTFYLLQGSTVTVSSCVRWPGASLIVIRGHKHLKECAYIGDNSSEELDEIMQLDNATLEKKLVEDSPSNKPGEMRRQLESVRFHDPQMKETNSNSTKIQMKITEHDDVIDPTALRKNLLMQSYKRHKPRTAQKEHEHIKTVPELTHRYRDTKVNEDEEKFIVFKDLEAHKSDFTIEKTHPDKVNEYVDKMERVSQKIEESSTLPPNLNKNQQATDSILKELNQETGEETLSSGEVVERLYSKLKSLGSHGQSILKLLNEKLTGPKKEESSKESESASGSEESDYKIVEAVKELINDWQETERQGKHHKEEKRTKRGIEINPAMAHDLNEEDERGNNAIEDDFEPDGIADNHKIIDETTLNDMSRSEFWSSFSSSEEALLECDGLILNLPLNPNKKCIKAASDANFDDAAFVNTITYKVPANGYYFFVFNSENEIQTNYLRVKFDIEKTVYDLSNLTMECMNSSSSCAMPLSLFSDQKVVLEVPISEDDSMWNEEFFITSECEPRTSIYLVCVIAVPILIVVIAFQ